MSRKQKANWATYMKIVIDNTLIFRHANELNELVLPNNHSLLQGHITLLLLTQLAFQITSLQGD